MKNRFLQRITAILAVVFLPLLATSAQATIDGVGGHHRSVSSPRPAGSSRRTAAAC